MIPEHSEFSPRGMVAGRSVRQRRPWRGEEVAEVVRLGIPRVRPDRSPNKIGYLWRFVFSASSLLRENGRTPADIANKMSRLKRERKLSSFTELFGYFAESVTCKLKKAG